MAADDEIEPAKKRMITPRQHSPHLPPPDVSTYATVLNGDLVALAGYCDQLPGYSPSTSPNRMSYLAIVSPDTPLSTLRTAFSDVPEILPVILTDDLLEFAAQIDPDTALQLKQGDWWGLSPTVVVPQVPAKARGASIARQLLDASMVLASSELTLLNYGAASDTLKSVAGLLGVDSSLTQTEQIAACFGDLEIYLDEQGDAGLEMPVQADADAVIPGLVAIYEEIDNAIFVVDSAETIATTNWQQVSDKYKDKFGHIQITTARLMPLLIQREMAVAFAISRYQLHWGFDLAASVEITTEQILRNAANNILQLYVRELPHSFITATDDEMLAMRIHDVQNQLLKVQLQYELLTMLYDLPAKPSPRLQMERTQSREKRMFKLRAHLREWLALYQELLASVAGSQSDQDNVTDEAIGISSGSTVPAYHQPVVS